MISIGISEDSYLHEFQKEGNLSDSDPALLAFYETEASVSLVVSSEISVLQSGAPVVGDAEEGLFSYYRFLVPQPHKMIEVSVIPLSEGDPDLFVILQKGSQTVLPTVEASDWISSSYKSDLLIIKEEDSIFAGKGTVGEYIVGVLGFRRGAFQLEVNFANVSILALENGRMMDAFPIASDEVIIIHHLSRRWPISCTLTSSQQLSGCSYSQSTQCRLR